MSNPRVEVSTDEVRVIVDEIPTEEQKKVIENLIAPDGYIMKIVLAQLEVLNSYNQPVKSVDKEPPVQVKIFEKCPKCGGGLYAKKKDGTPYKVQRDKQANFFKERFELNLKVDTVYS